MICENCAGKTSFAYDVLSAMLSYTLYKQAKHEIVTTVEETRKLVKEEPEFAYAHLQNAVFKMNAIVEFVLRFKNDRFDFQELREEFENARAELEKAMEEHVKVE